MGASRTSPTTTPGRTTRRTKTIKTKSSRKTSLPNSERLHRHDHEHHRDHDRRSDAESRGEHEHRSHRESSDGDRALRHPMTRTPKHRIATPPIARPTGSRTPTTRTIGPDRRRSSDEHDGDHSADQAKFASYDDDADADDADADDAGDTATRHFVDYSGSPSPAPYRAEPAHRPYGDFRAVPAEAVAGHGPVAQQTAAPRRAWRSLALLAPRTRRRLPIQVRPLWSRLAPLR